ncbi:MAG: LytTR family DNA-binding domain-containing protein [Flavobacteriaceae bacterium]|nr:LytTR family DNA-binding domain-containing protein [Flavobacteriaceae bacterium]
MDYTYTIIDSDFEALDRLKNLLDGMEEFKCVGLARTKEESLHSILNHQPRLLYIDMDNQPNLRELLYELRQLQISIPHIIGFSKDKTLAYNAIKEGFFDYLLKPISALELKKTLIRYKNQFPLKAPKILCLKSYKDYRYIDTREILYLQADNNATDFILKNGEIISAFKTLKHFQNLLPKNFVRIHNSYIINQDMIARIHYGKSKFAMKNSSTSIPFSRSYRTNVDGLKKSLTKLALHSSH